MNVWNQTLTLLQLLDKAFQLVLYQIILLHNGFECASSRVQLLDGGIYYCYYYFYYYYYFCYNYCYCYYCRDPMSSEQNLTVLKVVFPKCLTTFWTKTHNKNKPTNPALDIHI